MTLEIRTAAELIDPDLEARWATRRRWPEAALLRDILHAFVAQPGPVGIERLGETGAGGGLPDLRDGLARLDAADLIQMGEGGVELAYPFSGRPTAFVVTLAGRGDRYACCAIDALGVAPMLGEPVSIRSVCHHCRAPLALSVAPDGPGPEDPGITVWVGKASVEERRVATSL